MNDSSSLKLVNEAVVEVTGIECAGCNFFIEFRQFVQDLVKNDVHFDSEKNIESINGSEKSPYVMKLDLPLGKAESKARIEYSKNIEATINVGSITEKNINIYRKKSVNAIRMKKRSNRKPRMVL